MAKRRRAEGSSCECWLCWSEGAPLSLRGPGQSCSPASLCWPRPPTPRVLMLGHHCTQRGLCSPRVLFGPERPHPTGLQFLGGNGDPPASSSARQQPCPHAWDVLPSGLAFREPTSPVPSPAALSGPCLPHTKVGAGYKGHRCVSHPITRAVARCRSRLSGKEDSDEANEAEASNRAGAAVSLPGERPQPGTWTHSPSPSYWASCTSQRRPAPGPHRRP